MVTVIQQLHLEKQAPYTVITLFDLSLIMIGCHREIVRTLKERIRNREIPTEMR